MEQRVRGARAAAARRAVRGGRLDATVGGAQLPRAEPSARCHRAGQATRQSTLLSGITIN